MKPLSTFRCLAVAITFCFFNVSVSSHAQGVGCNNVFILSDSNANDAIEENQGSFTLESNPMFFNSCMGTDVEYQFTRIFKLPSGGPYEGFVYTGNSNVFMRLVQDCCREVSVCGDISSQFSGEIELLDLPVICADQEHAYVLIASHVQETFTLWYGQDVLFGQCNAFESCDLCPTQDCENITATLSCVANFYVGGIDISDTNDFNAECVYTPSECYGGNSSFNGADDLIAIQVGSTPKDISIALTGLSDDLDIFLFRDCSNGAISGLSGCVGFSLNSDNNDEVINLSNASGTYYLVIDGFEEGILSDYNVTLTCPCSTQDCENVTTTLSCAFNFYEGEIDNFDSNDFNTDCVYRQSECYNGNSSFNGADALIAIEIGSTPKDISITLTGLSEDLDLFLFRNCSNGEISGLSGCLGNSLDSINNDEIISLPNASGTYYLVIDGYQAGIVSPYIVTLTCSGLICEDPILIACGQDIEGDTGSSFYENINFDYSLCDAGSDFNGPDIVYQITDFDFSESTDIFIGLRELGIESQAGLDVFVIENCGIYDESGNSLATCVDYIERFDDSGVALLVIPDASPNSEYYVIVDSKSATGDFKLSVSCPETCTNDAPLLCNEFREANNSTNGSAKISSYYNPTTDSYYDGYTGVDYKIDFTAPAAGDYTVRLIAANPEGSNLDLFIMSECNPFQCIGQGVNEITSEEILLTLEAEQTIYLSVDAWDGNFDDFVLTIECCGAETSELIYDISEGDTSIVICRELGVPETIVFSNTSSGSTPYAYILTTSTDTIISEIPSTIDVFDLEIGKYRVHGVSYFRNLIFEPGQHISEVQGDTCEIRSNNYAVVCIYDQPTAHAGEDQNICQGDSVILEGTITNIDESFWTTTGDGSFDNPNLLNAIYTPGVGDIDIQSVVLILSTNLNQSCPPAIDSMTVNIEFAPAAFAGSDQFVCEREVVQVNGETGNTESSTWTTLGDGSFNDPTLLSAEYTPGSMDISSRAVDLILTTAAGENCPASRDTLTITIERRPMISAGDDQSICQGQQVQLEGSSTNTESIVWSTNGDGTFSNNGIPQPIYTPGTNDINSVEVTLTITTNRGEVCPVAVDSMTVNIEFAPAAFAGSDQFVCEGEVVQVNGETGNTESSTWTTLGDGSFNDPTLLSAEYTPGSMDISSRAVDLILTTAAGENCPASRDTLTITIERRPMVSAGDDQSICQGQQVQLEGSSTNTESIVWSTNGDGTFSNNGIPQPIYTPGTNDINSVEVTLTITTNRGEVCPVALDSMTVNIEFAPAAFAGNNQFVCEGEVVQVNGDIGNTESSTWTTLGDGSFNDPTLLSAEYTPGTIDISSTAVDLILTTAAGENCPASSDTLTITIERRPMVSAGDDQSICQDQQVQLEGSSTNAESIVWSTNGDGTFSNNGIPQPIYTPGTQDINAVEVTLTITTNRGEVCPAANDTIIVRIESESVANAGGDQSICEGNTVQLNGSVMAGTVGSWTTNGDGTFSDPSLTNSVYSPGFADLSNGNVVLTITSSAGEFCPAVSSSMSIFIEPRPTARVDPVQPICQGETIRLSGNVSNTIQLTWSTSGDGSFDNRSILNPIYSPGTRDIITGNVTLTITTNPGEICPAASDEINVRIETRPVANAGADQSICEGSTIQLSGSVTSSSIGSWTSSGDGTFNDTGLSNAIYTPGSMDIGNGTVQLTLTSTAGDFCPAASSTMNVMIERQPTVDAGDAQSICEGSVVQLQGSSANTTSVTWATSGDGSFSDSSLPTAVYTPGTLDINSGNIRLTLTTNSGTICAAAEDGMDVTVESQPLAFAGSDQAVCEGLSISLSGDLSNTSTGSWSSTGDGLFDDPSSLSTMYVPGDLDVDLGMVDLVLTTNGGALCAMSNDTLNVMIVLNPLATTNVIDTSICEGTAITLSSMGTDCVWYDASDNPIGTDCSINVSPLSSTTYRLEETNTSTMTSCRDEVLVTVDVVAPPEIRLIDDTRICEGGSLRLVAESINCQGCECTWSPAIGLDNPNSCDPTATPTGDELYTLRTSFNGICIEEQSVEIAVTDRVQIEVKNDHIPVRQNRDATLNLLENDIFSPALPSINQLSIELFNTSDLPSDLSIQDLGQGELKITAGANSLGLFQLKYLLTDLECGNQDEGDIEVQLFLNDQVSVCNPDLESVGCEIIPDLEIDFPLNDIVIWDRAGSVIHVAQPYANNWDGRDIQTNERVPSGPYYFLLNLGQSSNNNQSQTIRGIISILWK